MNLRPQTSIQRHSDICLPFRSTNAVSARLVHSVRHLVQVYPGQRWIASAYDWLHVQADQALEVGPGHDRLQRLCADRNLRGCSGDETKTVRHGRPAGLNARERECAVDGWRSVFVHIAQVAASEETRQVEAGHRGAGILGCDEEEFSWVRGRVLGARRGVYSDHLEWGGFGDDVLVIEEILRERRCGCSC